MKLLYYTAMSKETTANADRSELWTGRLYSSLTTAS